MTLKMDHNHCLTFHGKLLHVMEMHTTITRTRSCPLVRRPSDNWLRELSMTMMINAYNDNNSSNLD